MTIENNAISHWIYIDEQYPYISAPALKRGWVAAKFIKPLGRFTKSLELLSVPIGMGYSQVVVNEDWIQMGDRTH